AAGLKAMILPGLGDVFRNNSTKNACGPVVVSAELGGRLLAAVGADATLELTIEVERCTLEAPAIDLHAEFALDDSVRRRFLEGLDDIGLTLHHEAEIAAYERIRGG